MIILDFAIKIIVSLFHQRQITYIMKTKRESLTAIIDKTILLTRVLPSYNFGIHREVYIIFKIRKAAINEITRLDSTPEPSYDLANKTPGAVSVFDQIANVLANTPGSGYEFLKDRK